MNYDPETHPEPGAETALPAPSADSIRDTEMSSGTGLETVDEAPGQAEPEEVVPDLEAGQEVVIDLEERRRYERERKQRQRARARQQDPPREELSHAEIARREAEKSELLARVQSRNRPVDFDLDGPPPSAKPEHTPAEIQALIDAERARYHASQESAETSYKKRLDDLMARQRQAELVAARQVDVSVQERLRAATNAAVGPVEVDTRAADRERAEVQAKVDKTVKDARTAVADIEEIMDAHGDELDRLAKVTDAEWLRGLPTEGYDASRAYSYANRIPFLLDDLRNFVKDVRRGVETMVQDLGRLVASVPVPFKKDTSPYMLWVREFNGAMRDLGRINGGTVATVNSKISNLTGYVQMLTDLRAMYKGSPQAAAEFRTESPTKVIRDMERPNPNAPKPDRYVGLADVDLWAEPKR